ncbi:sigma-54-dependent Fis family transcriptional regulator [uncultured Muribaculum sp.]|uniref:sigma-54 interaction domain-containing protein n=1 Tax=uncultured Muribaculum sp. TaxID=1918613 RepID=UPI0027367808|nr:sigma-54 dependent transcriptional regulator [uncultured Muribaculum sp.]
MSLVDISAEVQQAKARFGIVGNAPALTAAVQRALRVAPIDLSVLITGESGTGKEFFPQIIHQYGARKHSKYIAVNCGAIPEGTIDSELFGHEKGAFTGAVASRKGYFEEADGGTIFLDEVAELPLTTQARLLRVLESGEFIKVGSSTVQKTNIRIVAATNVDMMKAIEKGRFREDLYYRLSTVHITVPPLRERGGDILLLTRKFAADFAERYRTPAVTFEESASHALLHYRWPGNVRQLKNVVEQIALFEAGNEITAENLHGYLPSATSVFTPTVSQEGGHSYASERELLFNMIFRMRNEIDSHSYNEAVTVDDSPRSLVRYTPVHDLLKEQPAPQADAENIDSGMTLEDTERETIKRALERNEGRRKATAQELNISERTLYRKIKEYGLE